MPTGLMNLHGDAPAGANVEVVDSDGNLIGSTTADINGSWAIDRASLPAGRQTIRAIAESPNGRTVNSPELTIDVEADEEPIDIEADREEDLRRIQADDEELAPYEELVFLFGAGCDHGLDITTVREIIENAGKSVDDLLADLEAMRIANE